MAYRVRDLLDTPHLRLTLKGGGQGLDTPVTWAQTSDLEEPWSYLAGGELLMKNGQTLPESARDVVLARLARLAAGPRAVLEGAALVGAGVRDIATGQHSGHNTYALTAAGLAPLP